METVIKRCTADNNESYHSDDELTAHHKKFKNDSISKVWLFRLIIVLKKKIFSTISRILFSFCYRSSF